MCSVAQSSSVTGTASGRRARTRSSACTVTPDASSRSITDGSSRSAAARCTSSVSSALQTLGRCTFALCTSSTAHCSRRDLVEEHVHDAGAGLDDGHARFVDDGADQPGAAARDEHVDVVARLHEVPRAGATELVDRLHGLGREPDGVERVAQHVDEHAVGLLGGAAAAQHHGVAALQREHGDVDRHVRAGLVDGADDAERHAHLVDAHSVRQGSAAAPSRRSGR